MFCSTIIPTVGRPSLEQAVTSVLDQHFDREGFEVIVVNDSGRPLHSAVWQDQPRVRIIHTMRRERSVARNTGASTATGRYLHFLDDDDWLMPTAFEHFWELSRTTDAGWLYGTSQLLDRDGGPLLKLQHGLQGNCFAHVMAGEWIPLQASLIKSDLFFRIGGFNPLLAGPEDIDCLRRAALVSELGETPHVVANIRRGDIGTTTDYNAHPSASRWAREKIIDAPGVYTRLRASALSSDLAGRVTRLYLTSAIWNLRDGRLWSALGRLFMGLRSVSDARALAVSTAYWNSVVRSYQSPTFHRGIYAANHR